MTIRKFRLNLPYLAIVLIATQFVAPAYSQTAANAVAWNEGAPRFAALADLTFAAPVIVRGRFDKAEVLRIEDAGASPTGSVRQLVTVGITTALRAPEAVPAKLSYIWDGPADARGKPVKLRGADVLVFLRPVDGKPGQYQLVSARAQIAASDAVEATIRTLLAAAAAGKAPQVTGIGNGFRVPGSVPGEAESQFFLTTRDGKPVSLVLLTRPGQPQSLQLALGDVIDEAASSIPRDTLLWYRIACFLPPQWSGNGDTTLAADYASALKLIGPCTR